MVLIRSRPCAVLFSTQSFQTLCSSKGESRRKRMREKRSSSLFWMGVPVTAQRRAARSRHTASAVCERGLRTCEYA